MKPNSKAPSAGDIIRIDYRFGESRYALVIDERGQQISIIYLKDYSTGWSRNQAWWIPRSGHENRVTIISAG
jgi:hypothetical protein